MDSNASSYYYLDKDDSNNIDLGLSLRVLQPQTCYPSSTHDQNYRVGVDEHHESVKEEFQSKERWTHVKVNMEGVVVGRKICILEDMDYLSLGLRLEDMFGKQTISGLMLFQAESPFALFYMDKDKHWRTVGDVPWRKFVDHVKRLRIARKDEPRLHLISMTH